MIERVQKVCLKILLSEQYTDYSSALKYFNITSLSDRREKRILDFCHRAIKHNQHTNMFPISEKFTVNNHSIRNQEKYKVNFAHTEAYKNSFLPYAQRKLNEEYFNTKTKE